MTYPPSYLTEEQVLDLANDGYALLGVSSMPIGGKVTVETVDPAEGLANAVCALEKQNQFGQLTALYVRKSSAELNLEEKK